MKLGIVVKAVLGPLFAILAALLVGGLILFFIGLNPFRTYFELFKLGMGTHLGITESLKKMAPLLIISAGLIIVFKAGIWNIGGNGQFLIGAIFVGGLAPLLINGSSPYLYFFLLALMGFLGGALWIVIPAILKAKYEINEIIVTMMMDFVALNFTAFLVRGPLIAHPEYFPQTRLIPVGQRLPFIPFTRIHIGLIVGLAVVILAHYFMKKTTWGYEFRLLGENKKAAQYAGVNIKKVTIIAMLISGGFAGLAGANDILGIKGAFQAEWNPGYAFSAIPLVFLARFNGIAVIPLAYFFSFLAIGGEFMSRAANVPVFFVQVLEALMLIFFGVTEYMQKKGKLFWKS
ncbi:ABC transporter permease [Candidatus Aerophobetes bacterium]|nr:ABC transporter permease [Candidatus Aerophobetes bacterium]